MVQGESEQNSQQNGQHTDRGGEYVENQSSPRVGLCLLQVAGLLVVPGLDREEEGGQCEQNAQEDVSRRPEQVVVDVAVLVARGRLFLEEGRHVDGLLTPDVVVLRLIAHRVLETRRTTLGIAILKKINYQLHYQLLLY